MSNTKNSTNGQPRRSLASQIDRLDGVIDALSAGLNEAVAQAVQESVGLAAREAVRGVLADVLGNPGVLALLREALASAAPPAPEPAKAAPSPTPSREKTSFLARSWAWLKVRMLQAREACRQAWEFRGRLLTGLGLAATAAAAWLARPWLGAGLSWLGGLVGSLTARVGNALRRTLCFAGVG